jgi:hypothetical protein
MITSKIYGVKSNAARAAQTYGLTRADLIAVSGGWCFNILSETSPQSSTERATEAFDVAHVETRANGVTLASEPAAPPDEPLEWGWVDYMVVNGVKPVELSQAGRASRASRARRRGRRSARQAKDKAPAQAQGQQAQGHQAEGRQARSRG